MQYYLVEGGKPLHGSIPISGAKNSVLPILAATLLTGGRTVLHNCPDLRDVRSALEILEHLGCRTRRQGSDILVDSSGASRWDVPHSLMREMRSSVIFLGPILARFGKARLSLPGGCEIGQRPIDLHLHALRTLGAEIREEDGRLHCRGGHLRGAEIFLRTPSVGATENAMLAACAAEGTTVISNAAREPEIMELQDFLRAMGACVRGAGSATVTVEGRRRLHGCSHRVRPDRIVAATYLCAAAGTGGCVYLRRADYRHLAAVLCALERSGCEICSDSCGIMLKSSGHLRAVPPVRTSPYPGFPTDGQAVMMAALLRSRGSTVFTEDIFTDRYRHVPQMQKLGALIRTQGQTAIVTGTERLHGAAVEATDLRGGAALVAAGLQAQGITRVEQIHHIERGYADIVGDLAGLGACISRTE